MLYRKYEFCSYLEKRCFLRATIARKRRCPLLLELLVDSTVVGRDFSGRNRLEDGWVSRVTSGRLLSPVSRSCSYTFHFRSSSSLLFCLLSCSFNSIAAFRLSRSTLSLYRSLTRTRCLPLHRSLAPRLSLPRSRRAFFFRPSFSVSLLRLPLFLVVITSLLLVISLRAIRSLDGRSSCEPIGCTQACWRKLFSAASYVNRARKPTFLRIFGLPLIRQIVLRKRDFFLFNN